MNIPLGEFSGSDATKALQATIEAFNKQSSKQTNRMFYLTVVIAFLTLVLVFGLGVQIWIST